MRLIVNEVVIRDVEAGDLAAIKRIIDKIWDFEELFEDEAALETALGIYFNQVLYDGTFGKTAVLEGEVVGVIFGVANGDKPKFRIMLEDSTSQIISLLSMKESDRANIREFLLKLYRTYDELFEGKENSYDGALDFLIVDEKAQGLKVGRKLWEELAGYFRERKVRNIYVFTDTSCNFGFYDHIGFVKKDERVCAFVFDDETTEETNFLYDFHFDTSQKV